MKNEKYGWKMTDDFQMHFFLGVVSGGGAMICFGLISINSSPSKLVWSQMKQPKSPWQQISVSPHCK